MQATGEGHWDGTATTRTAMHGRDQGSPTNITAPRRCHSTEPAKAQEVLAQRSPAYDETLEDVLCRAETWTPRSLWVPSSSEYSVMPLTQAKQDDCDSAANTKALEEAMAA